MLERERKAFQRLPLDIAEEDLLTTARVLRELHGTVSGEAFREIIRDLPKP